MATVVGVFSDYAAARRLILKLRDGGFDPGAIGFLAHDHERAGSAEVEKEKGRDAAAGATAGAVAGGLLGGLTGWLIGIGALLIPGVGPVLAAGPLAAAIAGLALGAGTGGVIGALAGMGVPEEHAAYYRERFEAGDAIVTVQTESRTDEVRRLIQEYGGHDIDTRPRAVSAAAERDPSGIGAPLAEADTADAPAPPGTSTEPRMPGRATPGERVTSRPQVLPGWDVVVANGTRLGTIAEVRAEFMRVAGEGTLEHSLFVPIDAIKQVETGRVVIDEQRAESESEAWRHQPDVWERAA